MIPICLQNWRQWFFDDRTRKLIYNLSNMKYVEFRWIATSSVKIQQTNGRLDVTTAHRTNQHEMQITSLSNEIRPQYLLQISGCMTISNIQFSIESNFFILISMSIVFRISLERTLRFVSKRWRWTVAQFYCDIFFLSSIFLIRSHIHTCCYTNCHRRMFIRPKYTYGSSN